MSTAASERQLMLSRRFRKWNGSTGIAVADERASDADLVAEDDDLLPVFMSRAAVPCARSFGFMSKSAMLKWDFGEGKGGMWRSRRTSHI